MSSVIHLFGAKHGVGTTLVSLCMAKASEVPVLLVSDDLLDHESGLAQLEALDLLDPELAGRDDHVQLGRLSTDVDDCELMGAVMASNLLQGRHVIIDWGTDQPDPSVFEPLPRGRIIGVIDNSYAAARRASRMDTTDVDAWICSFEPTRSLRLNDISRSIQANVIHQFDHDPRLHRMLDAGVYASFDLTNRSFAHSLLQVGVGVQT